MPGLSNHRSPFPVAQNQGRNSEPFWLTDLGKDKEEEPWAPESPHRTAFQPPCRRTLAPHTQAFRVQKDNRFLLRFFGCVFRILFIFLRLPSFMQLFSIITKRSFAVVISLPFLSSRIFTLWRNNNKRNLEKAHLKGILSITQTIMIHKFIAQPSLFSTMPPIHKTCSLLSAKIFQHLDPNCFHYNRQAIKCCCCSKG